MLIIINIESEVMNKENFNKFLRIFILKFWFYMPNVKILLQCFSIKDSILFIFIINPFHFYFYDCSFEITAEPFDN